MYTPINVTPYIMTCLQRWADDKKKKKIRAHRHVDSHSQMNMTCWNPSMAKNDASHPWSICTGKKGAETSSTLFIIIIKLKVISAQTVLIYIYCTLTSLSFKFCF